MQRLRAWLMVCGTAIVTLCAQRAHADEPIAPLVYDVEGRPEPSARTRTALTGLAVTAGWYGTALGASYLLPDAPGAPKLRVPVAGPWLALAKTGCPKGEECSGFNTVVRAILTTVNGIGQAGGLLVASEALFLETRHPARGAALHGSEGAERQGPRIVAFDAEPVRQGWILKLSGRF